MIKRFDNPKGKYIDKIIGQDRFAFSHSDSSDFYDLINWSKSGGYQGSVINFYDLESGKVYRPFDKKRNVIYSDPVYADGFYYFLQGNYDEKIVRLFQYIPENNPILIECFSMDEVNLYNLRIVGNPVHVISQEYDLRSYYPEKFSVELDENETVCFIEDGKIYMECWIERGWDDENNWATDEYDLYNKVIVKDFDGNVISEEIGYLYQSPDGTWWIA